MLDKLRMLVLVVVFSSCATIPPAPVRKDIFRAMYPTVYDAIQPYHVTDESQMPWSYQTAQGRSLHGDWAILKDTPRIDTAYRVPLPFKITKGKSIQAWQTWDPSYPQSPGLQTQIRADGRTYALVDNAGDGEVVFSAFIGGKWIECFWQYHEIVDGKSLLVYRGLKQDLTVSEFSDGTLKSDLMAWFPELSASWK